MGTGTVAPEGRSARTAPTSEVRVRAIHAASAEVDGAGAAHLDPQAPGRRRLRGRAGGFGLGRRVGRPLGTRGDWACCLPCVAVAPIAAGQGGRGRRSAGLGRSVCGPAPAAVVAVAAAAAVVVTSRRAGVLGRTAGRDAVSRRGLELATGGRRSAGRRRRRASIREAGEVGRRTIPARHEAGRAPTQAARRSWSSRQQTPPPPKRCATRTRASTTSANAGGGAARATPESTARTARWSSRSRRHCGAGREVCVNERTLSVRQPVVEVVQRHRLPLGQVRGPVVGSVRSSLVPWEVRCHLSPSAHRRVGEWRHLL